MPPHNLNLLFPQAQLADLPETTRLILEQLVRQPENNDGGSKLFTWGGLAAGLIIIFVVFMVTRCLLVRKPRRAAARHAAQHQQNNVPTGPYPQNSVHAQPPPPPSHLPSTPNPAFTGRYLYNQGFAMPPYLNHISGYHGQDPVRHAPLANQADSTTQRQARPRFNPDNLVTFDVPDDDKKNPCPICLGLLEEEPVAAGQCLHIMHASCLTAWLAKSSDCPVCRVTFEDPLADEEDIAAQNMQSVYNPAQTQLADHRHVPVR